MKKTLFLAICYFAISMPSFAQDKLKEFLGSTQIFYENFISKGKVDYASLKDDPSSIYNLIEQIEQIDFEQLHPNEKKAFLISAYNLLVIHGVQLNYPIITTQAVEGFFTNKMFVLGGKEYSLDQIEHELLNTKEDPRLHFLLVCGANGCPPIGEPIPNPENVDRILDNRLRELMNNKRFVRLNTELETVSISELFDWYREDFGGDTRALITFINTYRTNTIPTNYKLSYYTFDWGLNASSAKNEEKSQLSNLLAFTPSALFSKGQFELGLLNNYYVQNSLIDKDGKIVSLGQSQAFLSSTLQFTFGVNKKANVNFGIEARIATARYGNKDDTTPFDFLTKEGVIYQRTVLSSIGPRIKVAPFKRVPRLSLQTAFLLPISDKLENPQFVDHDRYTWVTQLLYDRKLSSYFQLFTQLDFMYRINRNSNPERNFLRTPMSAFINYFPNQNTTIFMFTQYAPRFENVGMEENSQFGLSQWFTQIGGGIKYQLIEQLSLELSYGNVILSRVDGNGYLMNFGLRYIHR